MRPCHESAVNTEATPGARSYAHRPRGALLVLVLAASLAALLPNAAQAHQFGPPGVNGAQINITPDGYNEPFNMNGREYEVDGTGFIADDVVMIFQCPVTRQFSLLYECQLLDVTETDMSGNFTANVFMRQTFFSVLHPAWPTVGFSGQGGVNCYGRGNSAIEDQLGRFTVQCSVVAVTIGRTTEFTGMGEHYICFEGNNRGPGPYETKCVDPLP